MSFNAAKAVAKYRAGDVRDCTREQFAGRLNLCALCVHRRDNVCGMNGEMVTIIGRRKASACPAGCYPALVRPLDPGRSAPAASHAGPLTRAWDWVKSFFPRRVPAPSEPVVRKRTQPIKALLIAPGLHNPGGIERWLIAMTRYVPEVSGRFVTIPAVIVRHPQGADAGLVTELSRFTRVVLCDETPQSTKLIQSLVAAADVILASGVNVNLPLGVDSVENIVSGSQCPVVFCSHSCCPYSEALSRAALESGKVRHWTSVGHTAKGIFPEAIADQVVAVENGAEIDRCTPVRGRAWQRQQWGIRDDQIVIGFVGRLHHEKRPTAVAEALQHLPAEYVGLVFGSGIHGEAVIAESESIAGDRVRFMGCVSYIGDILAGLDVWLLASPAEGFCLARVEAQLAGVSVVSTPTGEIPRLEAEHGQLTWPVPIGATGAEIAAVIQRSQANRFQARQIAERARELAWGRYTAPAMAGRWIDYFTSILQD